MTRLPTICLGATRLFLLTQLLHVPALLTSHAATVLLPGDVYIDAVLSQADIGQCGELDPFSVEHREAMKWTLDHLNTDQYIPGMKIGLRVHDTCRSPDRAEEIAFEITKQLDVDGKYNDSVGIVGPEYSSEVQRMSRLISGLPGHSQLLQIGYISTAPSLSDHETYSNFFRTITPDTIQTRTMRKFMAEMTWTYLAVIHDNDIYGQEAVKQLREISESPTTCFPEVIPIDTLLSEADVKQILEKELLSMRNRTRTIGGIVIFGSRNLGFYVLDTLHKLHKDFEYEIPVIIGSETNYFIQGSNAHLSNITKGMFITSPPRWYIEEFNDYWMSLLTNISHVKTDQTLSALYEQVTACNPNPELQNDCVAMTEDTIVDNLPQSFIVQYAVQAVLVMAKAVKVVRSNVCSNVDDGCKSLLIHEPKNSFIKAMDNMQVNFDDDFNPWRIQVFRDLDLIIKFPSGSSDVMTGTLNIPSYGVLNSRPCLDDDDTRFCFVEVFEYFEQSDETRLSRNLIRDYTHATNEVTVNIRKPQCPAGKVCTECPSREIPGIEVTEGDMYVVGIAPLHGVSDTPLKCGGVKLGGFDCAEAIKFQVQEAKDKYNGQVPDAKIGSIIIDSCWDPQIIAERVLNIHRNGVVINGRYVDVKDKILGYIGSWMSDITIKVAEILTRLRYVQISYGSTSPLLSNRELYPYFMRVVYSDVEQAKAMLQTVKQIGSNFVQILYSKSAYGIGGKNALVEHAMSYNICVSNIIGVSVLDQDFEQIKNELTKENAPKVVMVFLSSLKLVELLPMLDTLHGYMMVASEAWGTHTILQSVKNLNNSITLAYELPINDHFKTHMATISAATQSSPWLEEYMEYYFDCYFEWSFDKASRKRPCTTETKFKPSQDVGADRYKIETWVPFTATAVTALLIGARMTLEQVCGSATAICPQYHENQQKLIDNIRQLKIAYDGISAKIVFGPNNDGLIAYNKYQIAIRNGMASYDTIPENWRWPHSVCNGDRNVACDLCFPPESVPEAQVGGSDNNLGIIVALVVFVVLTVALAAVIIVAAWAYRRHTLCFKYLDVSSTYLSAVHENNTDQGYDGSGGIPPYIQPENDDHV